MNGTVYTSISENGIPVSSLYEMVWSHLQFMEVMLNSGLVKGEYFMFICEWVECYSASSCDRLQLPWWNCSSPSWKEPHQFRFWIPAIMLCSLEPIQLRPVMLVRLTGCVNGCAVQPLVLPDRGLLYLMLLYERLEVPIGKFRSGVRKMNCITIEVCQPLLQSLVWSAIHHSRSVCIVTVWYMCILNNW